MLVKDVACSANCRVFFLLLMNMYFVNVFCTCLFNSMKCKLVIKVKEILWEALSELNLQCSLI